MADPGAAAQGEDVKEPSGAKQRDRLSERRLQQSKLIRAVWQGALFVLVSLYLIDLGWSPTAVGVLFSASGLLNALAGWIAGIISDRTSRRAFLLGYEAMIGLAAAALAFFDAPWLITFACLLLGFGRSQSGIPAFAAPAEQAWLAQVVDPSRRGVVFSLNAALGFFGMAAGSLVTSFVPLIGRWLPGVLAYRPYFALVAAAAALNFFLLKSAEERREVAGEEDAGAGGPAGDTFLLQRGNVPERALRREENLIMLKMALINGLNGVAVGLTSPLLVYWFNLKFGAGPEALGPVFALTYAATGLSSMWTGRLSEQIGIVRAVVTVRLVSVIALVLVPLMPNFTLASILHVFRSAFGRGSVGARRALAVNLVRNSRRGLASSINNMSMTLPHAVGPSIAGVFLDAGQLALPFFLAAAVQFLYGTFYGAAFQRYEQVPRGDGAKGEERSAAP